MIPDLSRPVPRAPPDPAARLLSRRRRNAVYHCGDRFVTRSRFDAEANISVTFGWRSRSPAPLTAAPLGGARAATYEFLAAPQTDLNRVFRLDKVTGEVGACQYGLKDGSPFGVTLCYPAGEGAKAGPAGEYALVASRHTGEAGVFRVDLRTGFMSICFVLNETSVVCTTPAK